MGWQVVSRCTLRIWKKCIHDLHDSSFMKNATTIATPTVANGAEENIT